MTEWMRRVLESKRQARKDLAALPFSEKLLLLERLRDRSRLVASSPLRRKQRGTQVDKDY
jgi:dGTP triphosphohydrolase